MQRNTSLKSVFCYSLTIGTTNQVPRRMNCHILTLNAAATIKNISFQFSVVSDNSDRTFSNRGRHPLENSRKKSGLITQGPQLCLIWSIWQLFWLATPAADFQSSKNLAELQVKENSGIEFIINLRLSKRIEKRKIKILLIVTLSLIYENWVNSYQTMFQIMVVQS